MDELYELHKTITEIDIFSPPGIYIEELLKVICGTCDYRFGALIEVDDHGKGWMVASYNLPEDYRDKINQLKAPVLSSPSGEAIKTGRIVVVHDPLSDSRFVAWHDVIRPYNLRTVVWMPLLNRGRVFGTYVFYGTRIRDTSEEELHMLEKIRVMVSIALTSNQYLDQLNQKTKELDGEIADRKRAEGRAKTLAERTTILDAMGDGLIVLSMDGKVTAVNTAYEKLTGYEKNELVGRDAADLVQAMFKPEYLEKGRRILRTALSGKPPVSLPITLLRKDGREFQTIFTVSFIKDDEGKPTHTVITHKDFTELKRLQEKEKEAAAEKARAEEAETGRKKLEDTLEGMIDGVAVVDVNGNVIQENKALTEMFGCETLIGRSMSEFIVKEGIPRALKGVKTLLTTGMSFTDFEFTAMTEDGRTFPVIVNNTSLKDDKGKITGFIGVLRDVTERKRAEEKIRKSEEQYRRLFNGTTDAVFVHPVTVEGKPPGKFIEVNDVACQKLGYTRDELLKLSHFDIIAPEELENIPAIREKLLAGKHILFETVAVTKDGEKIPLEINIHQFDLNGHSAVLSIARDITRAQAGFGTILFDRPPCHSATPLCVHPRDTTECFDEYTRSGLAFADRHRKSSG